MNSGLLVACPSDTFFDGSNIDSLPPSLIFTSRRKAGNSHPGKWWDFHDSHPATLSMGAGKSRGVCGPKKRGSSLLQKNVPWSNHVFFLVGFEFWPSHKWHKWHLRRTKIIDLDHLSHPSIRYTPTKEDPILTKFPWVYLYHIRTGGRD